MDNLMIDKLKSGDERAFEYIYNQYYGLLCRFAYQLLGDSSLVEEIVDDVIFHLWEYRAEIEITVSIRAYLLRAVRNRCLNKLNTQASADEINFSSLSFPEGVLEKMLMDDRHPLGNLLEQELEKKLLDSIEKLPKECRAVFKKSRFEQKTYEEIASELKISLNTVKYHIKNALYSLHTTMGEYFK
ncbi:MAG: RNA polymerase sigma-70 factor [Tannerellaceae bacterium]|jgi:RNA polymerase sigma-70 factor (ECF subfamily)|nr:RNA polymerase sigma-70 factor [Tannerellaceae bacterium]